MAVVLHIVETSYDGVRVEPFEVPDGHTVTVRRHAQGADIYVVPGKPGGGPAPAPADDSGLPEGTPLRIRGLSLSFDDTAFTTLAVVDGQGTAHRFLLNATDLADFVRLAVPGVADATASAAADAVAQAAAFRNRVAELERRLAQAEAASTSHLRDMGATLVDKARARLMEAQAAEIERRVEEEFGSPGKAAPSPLAAYRVSVDGAQQRPGERVLRIGFDDEAGCSILAVVPFGLALKLAGLIGHAVADRVGNSGSA